jgi:hypothetical protein
MTRSWMEQEKLVGTPRKKIPFGKLIRKWKNNVTFFIMTIEGFGLVIGFIEHLYISLQHFTSYYRTQTSILSLLQSPLVIF